MYHNFVFCEGVADTGERGRSSECNFIIRNVSCIHLAFCTLSSLPGMYYLCMHFYIILYCIIVLKLLIQMIGYILKIMTSMIIMYGYV